MPASRVPPKHYNYIGLGSSKEKVEDTPDLLLVGYENCIQVIVIQYSYEFCVTSRSSSHQILHTLQTSYRFLKTINSQLAVVNEYKSSSSSILLDSFRSHHVDIEYENMNSTAIIPHKVSFDFHEPSFKGKKKETDAAPANSKENETPNFGKNTYVYDVDYSGKLELKLSFVQPFSSILEVRVGGKSKS